MLLYNKSSGRGWIVPVDLDMFVDTDDSLACGNFNTNCEQIKKR